MPFLNGVSQGTQIYPHMGIIKDSLEFSDLFIGEASYSSVSQFVLPDFQHSGKA